MSCFCEVNAGPLTSLLLAGLLHLQSTLETQITSFRNPVNTDWNDGWKWQTKRPETEEQKTGIIQKCETFGGLTPPSAKSQQRHKKIFSGAEHYSMCSQHSSLKCSDWLPLFFPPPSLTFTHTYNVTPFSLYQTDVLNQCEEFLLSEMHT